jgi:hypothetical protein
MSTYIPQYKSSVTGQWCDIKPLPKNYGFTNNTIVADNIDDARNVLGLFLKNMYDNKAKFTNEVRIEEAL